jgi:uncharacterized protein (TIGR02118 family)
MKCVTMIYPNKKGATFNFDYYLNRHIPWAIKLTGDKGTEVRKGASNPNGGPVPYICLCRFWINSEEEYRAVMEKHGKDLIADVANFTNVEAVVQIDEVLLNTEIKAAAYE